MIDTSAAPLLSRRPLPEGPVPQAASVLAVTSRPGQESEHLGGVLYAFRLTGADLGLLCLSRGEASPLYSTRYTRLEAVRPWELQLAAMALGFSSVTVASYPDGALHRQPGNELADRVLRAVRQHPADLLLVIAPEVGTSGDVAVAAAARAASRRAGVPVVASTAPEAPGAWMINLGTEAETARAIQKAAAAAHQSQSQELAGVIRRLDLLGGGEAVRWLVSPRAEAVTMRADGNRSRSVPASPQPRRIRGCRLTGAWRTASDAFRTARNRLEPTKAGQIWKQLGELGIINSSLQFAALFSLGFIPFLMILSVALNFDLSRAIVIRSGFSAQAGHDVAALFAHARAAPTTLSLLGLVLAVLGGSAISHMIQSWYAKIFRAEVHGLKAMACRAEWLAGVSGFVAVQILIGGSIRPPGGTIAAVSAQFLLSVAFWWWSLHCLLCGRIPWRRLFLAGLATAVCYTGLGVYIAYVMSSSMISNEAMYGPFGAVITLLTAEIGLGVSLQLGAVIGAAKTRDGHHPDVPVQAKPPVTDVYQVGHAACGLDLGRHQRC